MSRLPVEAVSVGRCAAVGIMCMCTNLCPAMGKRSNLRNAWNNLGVAENMSPDFTHAWQQ